MTEKSAKLCKRCGTSERYRNGSCKQCTKERAKIWQKNNPDKAKKTKRKWKTNNPDKHREQNKRWAKDNPSKNREQWTRWKKNNPEKVREQNRRWKKNNREKDNASKQKRRTRKTGAGGSFTHYEWKQVIKQQNGRCLACGKKTKLTADHVIPVVKGGGSNIDNIQGLCQSCNSSKGTKTTDYRKQKGVIRWIQNKLF